MSRLPPGSGIVKEGDPGQTHETAPEYAGCLDRSKERIEFGTRAPALPSAPKGFKD
jgi:hypothetical protein